MILLDIICTNEDCISLYALDYWSIMHFFAGIVIYALTFLILYRPQNPPPCDSNEKPREVPSFLLYLICILATLIGAIIWEIFENTVMLRLGWKVRPDALINWSIDIVIVVLGGAGTWGLTYLMFNKKNYVLAYCLYGAINLALWLIIFFTLRFLTNLNL